MGAMPRFQPDVPREVLHAKVADQAPVPELLMVSTTCKDGVMTCTLGSQERKRWLAHPVHAPAWKQKVIEFDRVFGQAVATTDSDSSAPKDAAPPVADAPNADWSGEPTTATELLEAYNIVHNVSARDPFYTLHLVSAEPKDDKTTGRKVLEGQQHKLFLVGLEDGTVSVNRPIIGHGPAGFLKPDKGKKLYDEGVCGCVRV